MEIFLDDNVIIEEIKIEDVVASRDNGLTIIKGKPLVRTNEENIKIGDLTKELAAYDSMELGKREAARIHGISSTSAQNYANGKGLEEESKTRVLATKHNIADLATAKLMETLGLFDPNGFDKQSDLVKAAGTLAQVVDKVSSKERDTGNEIHLHMYAPDRRKLESFGEIIEVG